MELVTEISGMNKTNGYISKKPELALRETNIADANFIHALYTGNDFRQAIGDRGITTVKDAQDYIENSLRASYRQHGFGLWVIEYEATAIGICGLVKRDYLPYPDLGFALLPDFYGRGLARAAAEQTLDMARDTFQLSNVLAITSPENRRSQKLLVALGFELIPPITDPHTGHQLTTFQWQVKGN